jgi:catechol 2,3-dioxygenase-like lactoylglutathione lyase family enzyme
MSMIDHLSVGVTDLERGRRFYDAAVAPLGYRRVRDDARYSGYGPDESADDFYIVLVEAETPAGRGSHVAFKAPNRAAVQAFYRAALDAGGQSDGPPARRPEYHSNYYAAYVRDRDRNRVEAVCHLP